MCSSESSSSISSSTACLMFAVLPLRRAPSTVISALASENSIRSRDRAGREPAEHHVVRRADPRARQHRDDNLGDHRQEDPDDVALLDAEVLQRVGELLHVAVQVGVGDVLLLAFLAAPVERDAVAVPGLDVAVHAVVGGVDLAVREPLVEGRVGVVDVLGGLLEPVELLRLLRSTSPSSPSRPRRRPTDRAAARARRTPRAARTSRCRASPRAWTRGSGRTFGSLPCLPRASLLPLVRALSLGLLPRGAATTRTTRARSLSPASGRVSAVGDAECAATRRARTRRSPPSPARRGRAGPRPWPTSRPARSGGCPRRSRGWPASSRHRRR